MNTLFSSTRIIGYVNIEFEKADGVIFNIPINGKFTSSTDVIKGNSFKGHSNMALLLLQSDFIKI